MKLSMIISNALSLSSSCYDVQVDSAFADFGELRNPVRTHF